MKKFIKCFFCIFCNDYVSLRFFFFLFILPMDWVTLIDFWILSHSLMIINTLRKLERKENFFNLHLQKHTASIILNCERLKTFSSSIGNKARMFAFTTPILGYHSPDKTLKILDNVKEWGVIGGKASKLKRRNALSLFGHNIVIYI